MSRKIQGCIPNERFFFFFSSRVVDPKPKEQNGAHVRKSWGWCFTENSKQDPRDGIRTCVFWLYPRSGV